ncbi:CDP-2,3-bis-(O-geranylgeranyl)-sn-glycerol synthase [soil metagenome]
MVPVFAARLPVLRDWNAPLDFGKTFRGKRIFGSNKTWRGLVSGTLMGGLTGILVQNLFVTGEADLAFIFLAGCLMGFGALAGDAVESFFKRQRGFAPGASWFPFDQIDYIIGGLVFVYPISPLPWILVAAILVIYFGLHVMTSYLGYLIGVKSQPI